MRVEAVALSGMQHAVRGVLVSAQNVANLNTDGYRARRYNASTGAADPRHDDRVSPAKIDPANRPPSDVDLTEEIVDFKTFMTGFRANAVVIKIADRVRESLLDVMG